MGGGFPVKNKGKEKGVGRVRGGVGTSKGTGKSMHKLCRNYSLAIYPLVSPQEIPILSAEPPNLVLAFLVFLGNVLFFTAFFLSVFPFFSRDFWGSVGIQVLEFLEVFLPFPKTSRNERTGKDPF